MNSAFTLLVLVVVTATVGVQAGGIFGAASTGSSLRSRLTGEGAKQLETFEVQQLLARADDKDKTNFHGVSVRDLLALVPNSFKVNQDCQVANLERVQATCLRLAQKDTHKNLYPFCQQQLRDLTGRCSESLGGFKQSLINQMNGSTKKLLEGLLEPDAKSSEQEIQDACTEFKEALRPLDRVVKFLKWHGQPEASQSTGGKWTKVAEICK